MYPWVWTDYFILFFSVHPEKQLKTAILIISFRRVEFPVSFSGCSVGRQPTDSRYLWKFANLQKEELF